VKTTIGQRVTAVAAGMRESLLQEKWLNAAFENVEVEML
jgi:hypothetical protein